MRKASFARAIPRGAQCQLCDQQCVLDERQRGPCGVRLCLDGEVVSLATERLARLALRPVESPGFFHVLPGSRTLVAAVAVDAADSPSATATAHSHSIEDLPRLAVLGGAQSVAFAYGEPTFAIEPLVRALDLVRNAGLVTLVRSALTLAPAALELLARNVDAVSIELPSASHGASETTLRNLGRLRALGVWVEVTTYLDGSTSPRKGTRELDALAKSLAAIDPCVPWHVRAPSGTSAALRAVAAGERAGLANVYVPESSDGSLEVTFCHACRGGVLIERCFGEPRTFLTDDAACPDCGVPALGLFASPPGAVSAS